MWFSYNLSFHLLFLLLWPSLVSSSPVDLILCDYYSQIKFFFISSRRRHHNDFFPSAFPSHFSLKFLPFFIMSYLQFFNSEFLYILLIMFDNKVWDYKDMDTFWDKFLHSLHLFSFFFLFFFFSGNFCSLRLSLILWSQVIYRSDDVVN